MGLNSSSHCEDISDAEIIYATRFHVITLKLSFRTYTKLVAVTVSSIQLCQLVIQ